MELDGRSNRHNAWRKRSDCADKEASKFRLGLLGANNRGRYRTLDWAFKKDERIAFPRGDACKWKWTRYTGVLPRCGGQGCGRGIAARRCCRALSPSKDLRRARGRCETFDS